MGDPVFAIGNAYVSFSEDLHGGWGKVLKIVHRLPNGSQYESLYAHFDSAFVDVNTWVKKGAKIGTIGTANGQYIAHLHFEIRNIVGMPVGDGYLDPTLFIKKHRTTLK